MSGRCNRASLAPQVVPKVPKAICAPKATSDLVASDAWSSAGQILTSRPKLNPLLLLVRNLGSSRARALITA